MIEPQFKIEVRCGNKNPETQKIEWVTPKVHNLINNLGMQMLATKWVTECTENVYLESGGRVNARYSGATLISQNGTTLEADNAFFLNDQSDALQNRLLVFDDGTQTFITGFNSNIDCDAGTSGTVAAQPATIYYVEESQMDGFVKASTTIETTPGSNENDWDVSAEVLTITNKRTIEFPIEGADVTYEGVGWTPNVGDDQIIFGRKVLSFPVGIGTSPIVEVTINRRIAVDSVVFSNVFTGTSTDGERINLMGAAAYSGVAYYSSINTSTGATVAPTASSTFLECKVDEDMAMALGEYADPNTISNIDITGVAYATKTVTPVYTPGNYFVDYVATFTRTDLETADLYTIAMLNNVDDTEAFWRYLFDSPVDFTSKRFNDLTIRKAWSRYY